MFFPYFKNDAGDGYIFSALNCPCSFDDFEMALNAGTINETYKDLLIANLWDAKTGEKDAYFAPI